jgi:signal transduction histidine kinase
VVSPDEALFRDAVWRPALEKFGEVTRLTVVVYGVGGDIACGPVHVTPLFRLFQERDYEPGIFADCARRCLAQIADRPAIVVAPTYGLAVVGTSLVLEGHVVGAAVAGYAFIDYCRASAVERLARAAGVTFSQVWAIARVTAPVPEGRLMVHGELLQVLGDAILRENYRTRQHEETAVQLKAAAASKDDFLAVVSHELRTPLTSILLWSDRLKRTKAPAQIDRAVSVIERNTRLEARLVEDLLQLTEVARGQIALDLQVHELDGEVRLAVESVLETARQQDIDLRLPQAGEALPVKVDGDRTQQIFRNVLSNALKFTPAGGRIAVTVSREGGEGIVKVRDTGEGIAPEFLPFVFDMFRRWEEGAHPKHPGLGIGLAVVKRLVELHGGAVVLNSAGMGCGTEVVIRLPLLMEASEP